MRGVARTQPYPHGTRARYGHGGCRCSDCLEANYRYEKRRVIRNFWGRNPWVDASPVRVHVRSLMAPHQGSREGIGYRRIARLAGVNREVVRRLLYGAGEHGPSKRLHKDNAAKLMTVKPVHRLRAPGATVDAGPTLRIVECMYAHGISKRRMAVLLGVVAHGIQIGHTITVRRAADIAGLHWRFWRESVEFRGRCDCPLPDEIVQELEAS